MQRKNISRAWAAAAIGALLAVPALTAHAQSGPTAELGIKGTIVPPACQASFDAGQLNFGDAKIHDFLASRYFNGFTTRTTNLTVTCPAPRKVSFSVQDMKAGTQLDKAQGRGLLGGFLAGIVVDPENEFGLGTVKIGGTDVRLGSYAVVAQQHPTIDGAPAYIMGLSDGASRWSTSGMLRPMRQFTAGTRALIGGRPLGDGTPVAGNTFVFPLMAAAILNMPSELQLAEDVRLDGQLVFSIGYP